MCTAATYKTKDFYFGRTLDYEFSYGDRVTITPRNYNFSFRNGETLDCHYAMIGMACVINETPLYYDAVNEKGLAMAGLNFVSRHGITVKNRIACMQIQLFLSRSKADDFLHVLHQFFRCSCLSRIVSRCLNSAG